MHTRFLTALLLSPILGLSINAASPSLAQRATGAESEAAIASPEQCSQIIAAANQAVQNVQTVTQNNPSGDAESLLLIADVADQAIATMQLIDLSDTQLQGYRDRFVTMYNSTSQASRNLVAAVRARNEADAQTAYEMIVQATADEGPLVEAVNGYCGS
ncbi:MAG TPA: hypothetical protein V6C88_04515 [Chroococcidiopsis sp.]